MKQSLNIKIQSTFFLLANLEASMLNCKLVFIDKYYIYLNVLGRSKLTK